MGAWAASLLPLWARYPQEAIVHFWRQLVARVAGRVSPISFQAVAHFWRKLVARVGGRRVSPVSFQAVAHFWRQLVARVGGRRVRPISFQDPRGGERDVGLLAFYFPGHADVCDERCRAAFLGNFWDCGPDAITLKAPCDEVPRTFSNSEAAYQATKFWPLVKEFCPLSGEQAFQLKRSLQGQEDPTYAGFGSTWKAMQAVLEAKYQNPELRAKLLATGDAFLVEHNSRPGRDRIWSNNAFHGDGQNWLGMQLMLLRDTLQGRSEWRDFIARDVDLETGAVHGGVWAEAVRGATVALLAELAICPRLGCGQPAFKRRRGEFCSLRCRAGVR